MNQPEKAEKTCGFCGEAIEGEHQCSVLYDTTQHVGLIEKFKEMFGWSSKDELNVPFGSYDIVRKTNNERFCLTEPMIQVGRDRDSNVISIPDDSSVSRNHAWIVYLQGAYWVEDLGSTNGTFVNGKKVTKRSRIAMGDRLMFGKAEFSIMPRSALPMFAKEYEVVGEIGRGGMGIVYQAIDRKNKRMVAIKSLNLEASMNEAKKENRFGRFKREAMIGTKLRHRNIVAVYDITIDEPTSYYVMEFVEGVTFRAYLTEKGGKLTPEEYLPFLEQICAALAYAHGMKVTHRDVKPENIFITQTGLVKLTDFGIARAHEMEPTNLTKSGMMLGTLSYVSPEQLNNAKKVDHRSDIFSLGALSYEALAGRPPFVGAGIVDVVSQVINTTETPLEEVEPSVGHNISVAIAKALRKKPSERYNSATEFAELFKAALTVTTG
jgi:serine/threonine protein kinase